MVEPISLVSNTFVKMSKIIVQLVLYRELQLDTQPSGYIKTNISRGRRYGSWLLAGVAVCLLLSRLGGGMFQSFLWLSVRGCGGCDTFL